MIINLNDKKIEFTGNTVSDLVNDYGFMKKVGIAVAVNETVIPKDKWKDHVLKRGDSVLVITPAQGG